MSGNAWRTHPPAPFSIAQGDEAEGCLGLGGTRQGGTRRGSCLTGSYVFPHYAQGLLVKRAGHDGTA